MKAMINKGKPTAGHGERLRTLGYEVSEEADRFVVEVTELLTGTVTIPADAGEFYKAMIAEKKAFAYSAKVIFPNGEDHTSIFLCGQLEKFQKGLSCIVMRPVEASSRRAGSSRQAGGANGLGWNL